MLGFVPHFRGGSCPSHGEKGWEMKRAQIWVFWLHILRHLHHSTYGLIWVDGVASVIEYSVLTGNVRHRYLLRFPRGGGTLSHREAPGRSVRRLSGGWNKQVGTGWYE